MTIHADILAGTDELTALRHAIHENPELGMKEVETSRLVAQKLQDWGVEFTTGIGNTGIVATIKGDIPGERMIGLRADMDALPIHEQTNLPYASKTPGIMHACGHDGHTTMLLGAARHLVKHRDFAGTAVLIFQPAEEGAGGARAMVADGLFEKFPCSSIYAMHNFPGLDTGKITTRRGPITANCDRWSVEFIGTGGHGGGTPHQATDVTVAAGHFLLGVQTIVSRNVSPRETAVISVGFVQGGAEKSPNVMPAGFRIGGICRSFTSGVRETLKHRIDHLAATSAALQHCEARVDYYQTGWAVNNSAGQYACALNAAKATVGDAQVDGDGAPTTGGEDFGEMAQVVNACMILIGNGGDGVEKAPRLHTPEYDFNDEIIPKGVAYWVNVVQEELGSGA